MTVPKPSVTNFKLLGLAIAFLSAGCEPNYPSTPSKTPEKTMRATPQKPPILLPAANDRLVRYNAPRHDGEELNEEYFGDTYETPPWKYISTVSTPSVITEEEEVKQDAHRVACAYFDAMDLPRQNELLDDRIDKEGFFKFSGEVRGLFSPFDRTLETPVVDPDVFTANYVRHFQETLLDTWPLWRIHVVGTSRNSEESLMIYPNGLVIGDQVHHEDFEPALTAWRSTIRRLRDPTKGSLLRQFRHVRDRIPDLIDHVQSEGMIAIATFDNWKGRTDRMVCWLLLKNEFKDHIALSPERCGEATSWSVTDNGEIVDVLAQNAPYHLRQCTFPSTEASVELVIVQAEVTSSPLIPKPGGHRWVFRINPADVITDETLKAEGKGVRTLFQSANSAD